MSYLTDRAWSDKFIPRIKQIIGSKLIDVSSFKVDTQQATDLIVMNVANLQIAARLRRPGYVKEYGNEFTVRCERSSGVKTEFVKIMEGFGDWMFYGHVNELETDIIRWFIIDLEAFRTAVRGGLAPCLVKTNTDGETTFMVFHIKRIPENCILYSNETE